MSGRDLRPSSSRWGIAQAEPRKKFAVRVTRGTISGEPTLISHHDDAPTWVRLQCIDKAKTLFAYWHSVGGGAVVRCRDPKLK